MTINREKYLEKAGEVVTVRYKGSKGTPCFSIGWFFAMTEQTIRLKVTSTAKTTYESMDIPIENITAIDSFELN